MKKKFTSGIALVLTAMLVFAACGQAAPPAPPAPDAAPAPAPAPAPADQPADEPAVASGDVEFALGVLPRNETLFFGGLLWGAPNNNNPFAPNPSSPMVIEQVLIGARLFVFETLYMFNMLDGQLNPLLAGGPPSWNADMSVLTVPLNRDAHWSDGTPVTAGDVAATFDAHVRASSALGLEYGPFISEVVAVNDHTVEFRANMANHNPQIIMGYLPRVYVQQAAFLNSKFAQHGSDYAAFREDSWEGAPHTGPYRIAYQSSLMTVLERDDNYWGQAASMWGSLPVPRFLAHNAYADNDVKRASFAAGQIDVNQQFMASVWELWEAELPISTFLDNPPFYVPASMPSIWFNTQRPGLDQRAVRQAIALAIDYDQIAAAAMSGYSPTFTQAPRSIAAPLEGELAFVDQAALAPLQWGNQDIARANQILDEAGIVDTTGDGIRDWNGENLSFELNCPAGWTDWNASLEIVAAAGAAIGIELSTNFTEMSVWVDKRQTGDFDIIMFAATATNIAAPWARAHHALYVPDPYAERVFWGYHRMQNLEINELIMRAAVETDMNVLRQYYTEISRFLLEEKPLVYLMYRPAFFHTVNESVWTGFPEDGDGLNIPPKILGNGYGIAGLYHIRLVN